MISFRCGKRCWKLRINQVSFWGHLSWILDMTRCSECMKVSYNLFSFHWRWTWYIYMFNSISKWIRFFKSEVGLKQDLNRTKKSENSLVQYWEWYANGCVFLANEHVYSEWLCPFWLNWCVCLGTTRFSLTDVSARNGCTRSSWTDVSIRNDYAHSNRTDVYTLKGFLRISI